ncbi:tigger transposable element-derived protein 4-like [Haliotis asinina]|uniref:tigger transposable element-derived protein 4-like n=1 Tax=Haliotis asinina TaxID=109174 RepID=UPI0035321392
MDQGIIHNLKVHYRKHVTAKYLAAIENKTETTVSVLEALRFLQLAWESVSQTTIRNCFRHAGFVSNTNIDVIDADNEDDPEDDIPLSDLVGRPITLMGYACVDEDLATCDPDSEDSIVDEVLDTRKPAPEKPNNDSDPESDTESDEIEPPTPTLAAAWTALDTLIRFVEARDT